MAGYTKEFLIGAFLSRYVSLPEDKFEDLVEMAYRFWDEAGKEKFRTYCSLDADAIKVYKQNLNLK